MTINNNETVAIYTLNCYITIEPCVKLKNLFSNLSAFYIVDVDSILKESGLDINKKAHQFLINSELKRLLTIGARGKRYRGLIYINSKINMDVINSVRDVIMNVENSTIENFDILDDCDVPKLKDYYELFDEVIFFPTNKKPKFVKCSPVDFSKLTQRERD